MTKFRHWNNEFVWQCKSESTNQISSFTLQPRPAFTYRRLHQRLTITDSLLQTLRKISILFYHLLSKPKDKQSTKHKNCTRRRVGLCVCMYASTQNSKSLIDLLRIRIKSVKFRQIKVSVSGCKWPRLIHFALVRFR